MATTNVQSQSGNRVAVMLDGIQVGAMQSVRMSASYGLEPVYGIGDIDPLEHVPTAARYPISVSNVVLRKGALRKAGLAPENGAAALKGVVFDIEVYSKDDGTLLQKYQGCSYDSGDVDVSRNAIVMSSAQFMALTISGNGF